MYDAFKIFSRELCRHAVEALEMHVPSVSAHSTFDIKASPPLDAISLKYIMLGVVHKCIHSVLKSISIEASALTYAVPCLLSKLLVTTTIDRRF